MPTPKETTVKSGSKTAKRQPKRAAMRPVQPDDKLAAIVVGSKPLPRSELTRKLWDYIKKHGCQDKKKRTMTNADDERKPLFDGKLRDVYRTRSRGAGAMGR